ncbi:MAG: maleylpyruvate isomerase N-terminal domain-containing protein [Actinomycetota bacterium]|nr:maleylpyruvate isomerase N-terminal domain-containing protein [Actinomycetota bacterium]
MSESLAAIRAEGQGLDQVLAGLPDGWPDLPTRLGAWTLRELVAHLLRGPSRVTTYLAQDPPERAEIDWLDYWRRANTSDPSEVAARASTDAASTSPEDLVRRFGPAWRDAVAAAERSGADRVTTTPLGAARLDHYLTSRVVELTVHGLDVRAALGLPPEATPRGLDVTTRVLTGLLGRARPADLADDVSFVLAATGRVPHGNPALPVLR